MTASVLVQDMGTWRVITLNRPEKLNAFNVAMHEDLAATLAGLGEEDACRAILLTGAGRGFCAGQDLDERKQERGGATHDLGATIDAYYNPLVKRLRAIPKPVVCAVNGVAAGAGANLALACDIVLAAHSAKFIQSFVRIGLVPDTGGTFVLPRLVGDARARALMMLGLPIDAQQAERWGLIWKAVPDADLRREAESLTAVLASLPTQALGLMKAALTASTSNTLDQQLDLERDSQRIAGYTLDYAEGVNAFSEKRKPCFSGRKA